VGINKVAASWGFAEATLFFIVPDVWLSIVGRNSLKKGLIACCYSLFGALLGGIILYWWGAYDFQAANAVIEIIPAINSDMLTRVHSELSFQGPIAVLLGPLSGTPYKTYAIQAANADMNFIVFLLISIPARLIRFTFVAAISYYVSQLISAKTKLDPIFIILGAWFLFYLFYFTIMPS